MQSSNCCHPSYPPHIVLPRPPAGQEFVRLSDGRDLCLGCLDTIVVDTADAQPLYGEVLKFFSDMGMPHPERPPLMLVDATALNEYSNKEGRVRLAMWCAAVRVDPPHISYSPPGSPAY